MYLPRSLFSRLRQAAHQDVAHRGGPELPGWGVAVAGEPAHQRSGARVRRVADQRHLAGHGRALRSGPRLLAVSPWCGPFFRVEAWCAGSPPPLHLTVECPSHRLSQPGTWEVYLGLHDQNAKTIERVMKRDLKTVIQHPSYNPYTYDYDIALMQLDSPVSFSQYIMPICLPNPAHDFPVAKSVWITGWGKTQEDGEPQLGPFDVHRRGI